MWTVMFVRIFPDNFPNIFRTVEPKNFRLSFQELLYRFTSLAVINHIYIAFTSFVLRFADTCTHSVPIFFRCQKSAQNRGDICLRCTKITLAHELFVIFCFFVVRRAKRLKFSIVIHWFLRVKENFWLDVID